MCDITNSDANRKAAGKYGITGYPTIVFLDPKGEAADKQVGAGGDDALLDKFKKHVEKYPKTGWGDSIADALASAKEAKMPALYLFLDESDKSKAAMAALRDDSLAETLAKFKKARAKFAGDEKAFKAEIKAYKGAQVPSLVVLDPNEAEPGKKPLKVITTLSKAKDLKKALDEVLKKFETP